MTVQQQFFSAVLAAAVGLTLGHGSAAEDPKNPKPNDRAMKPEADKQASISGHVYTGADPKQKEQVADAVVYLGATDGLEPKPDLEPVTAKVKDGRLVPEQIVVAVGQKLVVEVEGKDPYSLRFASPQEPEFGTALPRNVVRWEKLFTKPAESVPVTCDIHPDFKGVVVVVPNRAFVRTEKDGSFRLSVGLPVGKYEVCAYHPKYGRSSARVEMEPGKIAKLDFYLSRRVK